MSDDLAGPSSSFRHSCESCRRKKTRCPGEKPICSFCKRLEQECVYLPRSQTKGTSSVQKEQPSKAKRSSRQRVRKLESQVDQLYGIIESIADRNNLSQREGSGSMPPESVTATQDASNPNQSTWPSQITEPPDEVIDIAIDAYSKKVYFQPLPLFNLQGLRENFDSFPQFLQWGFLALCLRYFNHPFYRGKEASAIDFYTTASRKIAMAVAFEGAAKLEIQQALCLLALCDTMAGKHARAWMCIGTAARLEALRVTAHKDMPNNHFDADANSRCYWSISMLEKMCSPQSALLIHNLTSPDYPQSVPRPQRLASPRGRISRHPDISDAHEVNRYDQGMNAYCIQQISIWGNIIAYLTEIRSGKVDHSWLPTSRYTQIAVELYELENKLPHEHLIRNVSFPDRSPAELARDQEYWTPWVLMQIASHAGPAVLNNPFVQLIGIRDAGRVSRPRSFLQQTVDQALFHARWVFRMIQICEDVQFEIYDPMIAQLVAATATIPWLFQFARDRSVSKNSKEDLQTCEKLLARLAKSWPQVARKYEIFQSLQSSINNDQLSNADKTTVTFQPGKLWDLLTLDAMPYRIEKPKDNISASTEVAENIASATLHVTTRFIHPVEPLDTAPQETTSFPTNFGQSYEDLSLNQFLSDSMLTDFFDVQNYTDFSF